MELENMIAQGEFIVHSYNQILQKEKERQQSNLQQSFKSSKNTNRPLMMMMMHKPQIEFSGPDSYKDEEIPLQIREKDIDLDRARQMFR